MKCHVHEHGPIHSQTSGSRSLSPHTNCLTSTTCSDPRATRYESARAPRFQPFLKMVCMPRPGIFMPSLCVASGKRPTAAAYPPRVPARTHTVGFLRMYISTGAEQAGEDVGGGGRDEPGSAVRRIIVQGDHSHACACGRWLRCLPSSSNCRPARQVGKGVSHGCLRQSRAHRAGLPDTA